MPAGFQLEASAVHIDSSVFEKQEGAQKSILLAEGRTLLEAIRVSGAGAASSQGRENSSSSFFLFLAADQLTFLSTKSIGPPSVVLPWIEQLRQSLLFPEHYFW